MTLNRSRFGGLKHPKLTAKRAKALLGLAAVVPALAIPASASASTVLIGSGSSAAQPYMLALFNGYHKLHKSVSFKYNPDGGNAGVKDVQNGISQFGGPDRGAASVADPRHVHEALPGRALHRRQLEEHPQQPLAERPGRRLQAAADIHRLVAGRAATSGPTRS